MASFRKYSLQPVTKHAMRSREKLGMASICEMPRNRRVLLPPRVAPMTPGKISYCLPKLPQIQVS